MSEQEKTITLFLKSIKDRPLLLLVFGLGSGSIGGGIAAPAINSFLNPFLETAIEEHNSDEKSHNLHLLEDRMSKLEFEVDKHDDYIKDLDIDIRLSNQKMSNKSTEYNKALDEKEDE
jgi:hypothetical protein